VTMHFCIFCRVHQTLRVTPAMRPGLADHVWRLEEVVGLLDAAKSAVNDDRVRAGRCSLAG